MNLHLWINLIEIFQLTEQINIWYDSKKNSFTHNMSKLSSLLYTSSFKITKFGYDNMRWLGNQLENLISQVQTDSTLNIFQNFIISNQRIYSLWSLKYDKNK